MNLLIPCFSGELHTIHNHTPTIVKLWQFVTVKYQSILTIPHDLHISLQHLCAELLAEYQGDIMLKSVTLAQLDVVVKLLEGAKENHTGCLAAFLRLFDKHLTAKVHELGRLEILVGIEKLFPCKLTLAILVITVHIPSWIAGVCVHAQIIGRVGDNELRFRYLIDLEVLEVVIEKFYSIHDYFIS